jgi:hypothetical protein
VLVTSVRYKIPTATGARLRGRDVGAPTSRANASQFTAAMLCRLDFPGGGGDCMTDQPKTAQVADVAFVHAVGELYRLAIRTRPWDKGGVSIPAAINALQLGGAYASLSEDDKFQARVVVIGLVTVDCALELVYANEANRVSGEREDHPTTPPVGLLCASQLLNALVRRSSDPAWRYISAIRSVSLGAEAIPAESDASWRRNYFAGFVQALRWAAEQDGNNITRGAAIEQVSEACGFTDQPYTLHSLRGWIRRGEVTAAGMWADCIYTQAERLKDGRPLSERVMSIGPKLWSESPALHDLLSKIHTALHKT